MSHPVSCYSFFKKAWIVYRVFKGDQPWVPMTDYHRTQRAALNAVKGGNHAKHH